MPLSRVFGYGKYHNHTVEVRIKGMGDEPVLKNVPQGVCPVCGGRVYKAQVLERIEATYRGTQIAAKETPVPLSG